jgi:hypothetical protein
MSDEVIALIITIAIIALFFVWVPLLNFVCPPCGRFLERCVFKMNRPNCALPSR